MPNNRRFSEIMLGLFLLILGLVALGGEGSVFMTLLVLGGILMLVRQFEAGRRNERGTSSRFSSGQRARDEQASSQRTPRNRIYHHALEAVEAAGLDPESVKVLTTDIGVMSFKENQEPIVHRSRDVFDDVDYIQPYVQLRLPTAATGLIRFEIVDADGQKLFVHEERHQLERGRNLITPAARLPVHDAFNINGDWELRVSADGMPLAIHTFGWQESREKVVRRHVQEDGELSNELRAAMAESRLQDMSLDDLLAYQDDEEQEQAARRG